MNMEQTITHQPIRTRVAAAAVGAVMLAGLVLSILAAGPQSHDLAAGKTTVSTSTVPEDKAGTRWG
jgi:hypothetical protein